MWHLSREVEISGDIKVMCTYLFYTLKMHTGAKNCFGCDITDRFNKCNNSDTQSTIKV